MTVTWRSCLAALCRSGVDVVLLAIGVSTLFDYLVVAQSLSLALPLSEWSQIYVWMVAINLTLCVMGVALMIGLGALAGLVSGHWGRLARVGRALPAIVLATMLVRSSGDWLHSVGVSLTPRATWWIVALVLVVLLAATRRSLASATVCTGAVSSVARVGALVSICLATYGCLCAAIPSPTPVPATGASVAADRGRRPNIVLITIDSFSARHASLYGYVRPTTPQLQRFARQATVFERFYANANWTVPGIANILYGVYPWNHRAMSLFPLRSQAQNSVLYRLKQNNYQNFVVSSNYYASPSFQGVDKYVDKFYEKRNDLKINWNGGLCWNRYQYSAFKFNSLFNSLYNIYVRFMKFCKRIPDSGHFDPELVFEPARNFIEARDTKRPFFAWMHLFPPHAPYAPPAEYVGMFDPRPVARTSFDSSPKGVFEAGRDPEFPQKYVGRYDESIRYVDDHIGRFLDWLEVRGILEETIVVITADHGESFGHRYGQHGGPELYEDLIHIPLLIKMPHSSHARRVETIAQQVDLLPTLLEAAGLSPDPSREGISLIPALQGQGVDRPVFAMNFQQSPMLGRLNSGSIAMLEGVWKYIHYRGDSHWPDQPTLNDALFLLRDDPEEERNLIAQRPEIAQRMRAAIEERLRAEGGPRRW